MERLPGPFILNRKDPLFCADKTSGASPRARNQENREIVEHALMGTSVDSIAAGVGIYTRVCYAKAAIKGRDWNYRMAQTGAMAQVVKSGVAPEYMPVVEDLADTIYPHLILLREENPDLDQEGLAVKLRDKLIRLNIVEVSTEVEPEPPKLKSWAEYANGRPSKEPNGFDVQRGAAPNFYTHRARKQRR